MIEIDLLLLRHLSGTASTEDETRILRWIRADPANRERVDHLRRAWIAAATGPEGVDPGRSATPPELTRLSERASAPARESVSLRAKRPRKATGNLPGQSWHASPLARVAAVLGVIIGSAVILSTPGDRLVTPPMQAYATAAGERSTLRLGDGSRIVLAPASSVRLSSRFPHDARDVQLEGTAYFEVAPDAEQPFRVFAGNTVTQVLGTRFVVRAYASDPAVEVGVAEGRVEIHSDAAPEEGAVELTDGQVARFDTAGTARVLQGAALDRVLGWVSGRLVFRERPLHEIARELERWYGVEIQIEDPDLAARTLTLSFEQAPVADVLEVIAASLDAELQMDGRNLTLSRGREAM